jgi:hypothetical protein
VVPPELESEALADMLADALSVTLPAALVALEAAEPAADVASETAFLLEEHPLKASEAAAPTTSRPIALLRMGNSAFRG